MISWLYQYEATLNEHSTEEWLGHGELHQDSKGHDKRTSNM